MTEIVTDVVVAGGGSAGLSAGLTLARARRSVIVVDSGTPRNAPAEAAHGLLGREGVNPLALLETGRREVTAVGGRLHASEITDATADDSGVVVTLADGRTIRARALLVATGVRDDLPDIPGVAELWGRDVVHCPYCHGWEIRDREIAVLGTGPMSAKQALMFRQWSDRVTFLSRGMAYTADDLDTLSAVGIPVRTEDVEALVVQEGRLSAVRLAGGARLPFDAVAVGPRSHARLDGLGALGLEVVDGPMGSSVVADAMGRTALPTVFAAGNVVDPNQQVSQAAAQGARAAMTINTDLVLQDAAHALTVARAAPADA